MIEDFDRSKILPIYCAVITIMRFVFSKLFYLLLAAGLIMLSLSWGRPWLRWTALVYDVALILIAIVDARRSKLPGTLRISREFGGRFAVGASRQFNVLSRARRPARPGRGA